MAHSFQVGITADFRDDGARLLDPVLAEYFDPQPDIRYEFMEATSVLSREQIQPYDAIITLHPRVTAETLLGNERLAVIARWGVGYDMIDVAACTANDVLVAITPDGVRRPVAEGILTLLLALTHHLLVQDTLVRTGRWHEKTRYPGIGLAGRTLGSVGVGNIGTEMFRLLQPFGLGRLLAYDPYVATGSYAELGVEQVDLDTLLEASDFVCINCPLTPQTRHLIAEPELRRMRPTALLINTARGPIVDQDALTRALQEGWIGGAGLDVFEQEPIAADDPLLRLTNVILAPHAIAWTDAMIRGNSVAACENVLAILRGDVPRHSINREVVERPGFQAKLHDLRTRGGR